MQEIIENGLTVLIADPGMKLTSGVSYVSRVILGKEDSAKRWLEITEEEAILRISQYEDEDIIEE